MRDYYLRLVILSLCKVEGRTNSDVFSVHFVKHADKKGMPPCVNTGCMAVAI